MDAMKELYEKVSKDTALQEKFTAIMKHAEQVGEEATKEKLIAFAKETGYDVTMNEMLDFFKELAETKDGELSGVELDQVAGGKTGGEIFCSIVGLGIGCGMLSIVAAIKNTSCSDLINDCLSEEV